MMLRGFMMLQLRRISLIIATQPSWCCTLRMYHNPVNCKYCQYVELDYWFIYASFDLHLAHGMYYPGTLGSLSAMFQHNQTTSSQKNPATLYKLGTINVLADSFGSDSQYSRKRSWRIESPNLPMPKAYPWIIHPRQKSIQNQLYPTTASSYEICCVPGVLSSATS
jgi:hypothetical protein